MTILGEQSLAELRDLISAKDVEFNMIRMALANTPQSSWPNNAVYNDWMNDWITLQSKYNTARAKALADIDAGSKGFITDLSIQPAQDDWNALIASIQPVHLTTTKGDLVDVHQRLNAIKPIASYVVPQPIKSSDFEQTLSTTLAPYDPLGNPKAAANWKKDLAVGIGATVLGGVILAAIYKKI